MKNSEFGTGISAKPRELVYNTIERRPAHLTPKIEKEKNMEKEKFVPYEKLSKKKKKPRWTQLSRLLPRARKSAIRRKWSA